jgi:hypothetical protein
VFQTRQEGAGAFIRLKTGDELLRGKTLVRAIRERYELDDQEVTSANRALLGATGIVVEMPGLIEVQQRLKRLDKLKQIGLEGQYISSVGDSEAERMELRERLRGEPYLLPA